MPDTDDSANDQPAADKTSFEKKKDAFAVDYDCLYARSEGHKYFMIHESFIATLCEAVACPQCHHVGLQWKELTGTELQKDGLNHKLQVSCGSCHTIVCEKLQTSPAASNSRYPDVNSRTILAMRAIGAGHASLQEFCRVMGLPGISINTYQSHTKILHDKCNRAAEENLQQAARTVRQAYEDADPDLVGQEVIDIAVSYDGTWQKRGHTSHNGLGVVIDLMTGLVLDTEIRSNYCSSCALAASRFKGYDTDEFRDWRQNVHTLCEKNHSGSAASMEAHAAVAMFGRSVDKHRMRYTTVLSDGDSKTVKKLNDENTYDVEIRKEECVNHISKRMFARLDNFATRQKARGNSVGGRGKGKLTKVRMKRWSTYYRNAISKNVGDVDGMHNSIWAILYHSTSTEADPRHQFCPQGEESWCFYQKAVAKGECTKPPESHDPIPEDMAVDLLHDFEALSDDDRLERCCRNMTQNTNESFNGQVWKRAPKTLFSSRLVVELAVSLALQAFNRGAVGVLRVMHGLGLRQSHVSITMTAAKDRRRSSLAAVAESEVAKKHRATKKQRNAKQQDKHTEKEGEQYGYGLLQ